METVPGRRRPVGVDRDHRRSGRSIRDRGTVVDTWTDTGVIWPGQYHPHTMRGQRITDPARDIPIEGMLGVTAVSGGAGGVTRFSATATVGDRTADHCWMRGISAVVTGI